MDLRLRELTVRDASVRYDRLVETGLCSHIEDELRIVQAMRSSLHVLFLPLVEERDAEHWVLLLIHDYTSRT